MTRPPPGPSPSEAVGAAYARLAEVADPAITTTVVDEVSAMERARGLEREGPTGSALWGQPFMVKDNIDVAGLPTTAGCPAFAYEPEVSATVVRRLEAAGAIVVAKTNLDQFATGLVGTRSPYGMPRNPRHPDRIPGGSSSGSAVAVAHGIVPFALGTDTAGSGRVPAAYCDIVGLKPTCGWLSIAGVVPAVRSLDCVSVFASSVALAWDVVAAAAGFDADDPFSRHPDPRRLAPHPVRIGLGAGANVDPGDWGEAEPVDIAPFLEAGRLLYGGPWVSERYAAVGPFIAAHLDDVEPSVRSIILDAAKWSAVDLVLAREQLAVLRRATEAVWEAVDVLVLPTTPLHPTPAEVAADPIGVNARVGTYTTFVNLLDLCTVALPPNLSVIAPAWADHLAASVAARLAGQDLPVAPHRPGELIHLAVVGAHLRGFPLHHQLARLGTFERGAKTAATYRLYALAGATPPKPGLVRVTDGNGAAIEVEIYALDPEGFGRFVAAVPPPLAIGTVTLHDGSSVHGFLCESAGLAGATDITQYGGWRAYCADR